MRKTFWLVVMAWALCIAALLATTAYAIGVGGKNMAPAETPSEGGRLPGDDVPAEGYASIEADENLLIEAALLDRAHSLGTVTVTAYCICEDCCGKSPDHPAYGITRSGLRATPGVSVAVDPDTIPLGSDVLIDFGDGVECFRADDTGGAIKGNRIDVCMASHEEALEFGVKTATVWWAE